MIEEELEILGPIFPALPVPAGGFDTFRAGPVRYRLRRLWAGGLGNIAVLCGRGPLGLMQLETLLIDPFERDMPLLSCDYIASLGKRMLLVEYYDTMVNPSEYRPGPLEKVRDSLAGIPEMTTGGHWYDSLRLPASFGKKGGPGDRLRLQDGLDAVLTAYVSQAQKLEVLSGPAAARKRARADDYVQGLLGHGGPSTDVFMRELGAERTRELFERYLFATKE